MKNLFLSLLAVFAITATSCSHDEVSSTTTFNAKMVNTVITPTGSTTDYQGNYSFSLDFVASTVSITATDVQFSPMMPKVSFVMKNIPFTMSTEKGYVINAKNITPYVNDQQKTEYTISSIAGTIYPDFTDTDGLTYSQVPSLSYTVNGYQINASQNNMLFIYNNSTTVTGGQSPFTTASTEYGISRTVDKSSCVITLKDAQFSQFMPKLNMRFNGIAFSPTATGYTLDCAGLTPTIIEGTSETPYPNYQISNLTGAVVNNRLQFTFTCTITDANNSALGTYEVTATGTIYKNM